MLHTPEKVWVPFRYFGYWDIPRDFVLRRGFDMLRFECEFDEDKDDYAEVFCVYSLPVQAYDLTRPGWDYYNRLDWVFIGEVPTASLEFDPTRRACVSMESLARHPLLGIPKVCSSPSES